MFDLEEEKHDVHLCGRFDGCPINTIADAQYFLDEILEYFSPDHLILVLGSNDLAEEIFLLKPAYAVFLTWKCCLEWASS